jgi:excinuclease UvrABC nuclease subunit
MSIFSYHLYNKNKELKMAVQNYELEVDGYWREPKKNGVPNVSGIYCVYSCVFNKTKEKSTVTLKKLIYIGESKDVRDRLSSHEKQTLWEKHLNKGEVLCYSVAKVSPNDRHRCEAALINKHTPPENTEYSDAFPFDETKITLSGKINKLNNSFTVHRS